MKDWLTNYIDAQKTTLDSIPLDEVQQVGERFHSAWQKDQQIFVFGNGGSAANASHLATDLGKGASDKMPRPFRVLSLNDNAAWMSALGNDYSYEDVFLRQLTNYARAGDIALTMSVSGSSPNLVKALEWCRDNGVETIALVGARRGRLAEIADHVIVINDTHYGRVEDAHMTIAHMLCYWFMEAAND